jgi:hypothetical protein
MSGWTYYETQVGERMRMLDEAAIERGESKLLARRRPMVELMLSLLTPFTSPARAQAPMQPEPLEPNLASQSAL